VLGVTSLLGCRALVCVGGGIVALSFALVHGAVGLVPVGRVRSSMLTRGGCALPGDLRALLSRRGPFISGQRVAFMSVHEGILRSNLLQRRPRGW